MPFFKPQITDFLAADDGAVTVDWVVLTAGLVGLCLLAYTTMERESVALAEAAGAAVGERVNELPGGSD